MIGRFISPDPITHTEPLPNGQIIKGLTVSCSKVKYYTGEVIDPQIINPQEHNRYSYADNNPFKYVDPDGHQVAIAAVGVAVLFIAGMVYYYGYVAPQQGSGTSLGNAISYAWNSAKQKLNNFLDSIGFGDNPNDPGKKTRDKLLEKVENNKLRNVINDMYRPSSTIGDGGTADAIRYETENQIQVGGKWHFVKGLEQMNALENVIQSQTLNPTELQIARLVYQDLSDAVWGAIESGFTPGVTP